MSTCSKKNRIGRRKNKTKIGAGTGEGAERAETGAIEGKGEKQEQWLTNPMLVIQEVP